MNSPAQLLGVPYLLGGRDPSEGLDCLGTTRVLLSMLGVADDLLPAPWERMESLWRSGGCAAALASSGFPPGWHQVDPVPAVAADGLVGVTEPGRSSICEPSHVNAGVGVVIGGRFWTSRPTTGVVSVDWRHMRSVVSQTWELCT